MSSPAESTRQPLPHAGQRRFQWLICFILVAGTIAVYWPLKKCGFTNFDDPDYVTNNPNVFNGLSWRSFIWAFTHVHSCNWHPLTTLSHMLDRQIFGTKAAGHHFVNLFFHIANTLLIFAFFKKTTGALWRSAMVAALFAWHPLHVESVAWISERKDVLSTFFGFISIWFYARYAESRAGGKAGKPESEGGPTAHGLTFPLSIFWLLSVSH